MESPQPPSSITPQSRAILELLSDEDSSVVALVLEQLGMDPISTRSRLEELLAQASGPARTVLLAELDRLSVGDPAVALKATCGEIRSASEFESFCWNMALYEDPRARIYESKLQLDELARRVEKEMVPNAGSQEQVAALRTVLADEEHFRGNPAEMHYDPRNGFLDKVLASRQGWATSLTAIYLLVGHRLGIKVEPVYFPGHFLARIDYRYFAPFHRGVTVEHLELEDKLARVGFKPDFQALESLALPLLAQLMTNNLVSVYTRADDIDNLLRWQIVLGWLQEVSLN